MDKKFVSFYAAMLKHDGKVTRCEEVTEGLFAVEYTFCMPKSISSGYFQGRFNGRFWLGEFSKYMEYLRELYTISIDNDSLPDDDSAYQELYENINKNGELDAARNDRDIPAGSPKGIFAKIGAALKRWFTFNTESS